MVYLLLILHIFHTFCFCFYCSLLANICSLGDKRYIKKGYDEGYEKGINFRNIRMCLTPPEVLFDHE